MRFFTIATGRHQKAWCVSMACCLRCLSITFTCEEMQSIMLPVAMDRLPMAEMAWQRFLDCQLSWRGFWSSTRTTAWISSIPPIGLWRWRSSLLLCAQVMFPRSSWHRSWPNRNPFSGGCRKPFGRSLQRISPWFVTSLGPMLPWHVNLLKCFASSLLGFSIAAVMEVADETHCGFLGCADAGADGAAGAVLPALGLDGIGFEAVGLSDLARRHLRPRWTGLDIVDFTEFAAEFQRRFRQHAMSRAMDIGVCTSPAVLCLLLLPFEKPLLGYLGEPLLLAVDGNTRNQWFQQFRSMVTAPQHFFACYNPFLSSMIEYQTGLALPIIRLHGLYTQVSAGYGRVQDSRDEILVVKGPNICIDSVCLLNRFMQNLANDPKDPNNPSSVVKFIGLDELGGAPYEVLVSFKATVLYPYDVALAIFYEIYTMCMPLLLPSEELLPFFVFRGLHSNAEFHHSDPYTPDKQNMTLPPFVPAMDPAKWFYAAGPWSSRTDFAKFPHLLRFSSVADLFALVSNTDWSKVSRQMQRFNEETLVQSAAAWAHAVAAVAALSVLWDRPMGWHRTETQSELWKKTRQPLPKRSKRNLNLRFLSRFL